MVGFYIYTFGLKQLAGSLARWLPSCISFVRPSLTRLLSVVDAVLLLVKRQTPSVCRSGSWFQARSTSNRIFLSFALLGC